MIKVFLFVFVVLASQIVLGLPAKLLERILQRDKMSALRDRAIDKCTEIHQIDTHSIIESLSLFDVPDEPMFKCWYNCFLQEMGLKKGRTIDWEAAKKYTKSQMVDEELFNQVDELYNECKAEVQEHYRDQCITAYEFILCEVRNWAKVGLPQC